MKICRSLHLLLQKFVPNWNRKALDTLASDIYFAEN